jgi:hypothetical protein
MHERIRVISHLKKRILVVDLSDCSAREVETIMRLVPEYVTAQPRSSVLLLADFSRVTIDAEALRAMKETAVFHKPFIKKTAWVGAEHIGDVFTNSLKDFSRRDFPSFATQEQALDWLAKD